MVSDGVNTRGAWWAGVGLLSAALLAPLLIADVPPLLDYPNHLARFVLLAAGADDPTLGPIFTPHWAIIPNLATDVIAPPLLRLLPVHVAGRCLLGGILLLNLAGVLALHRALFGRLSFWPLASGLVAYNSSFLLGFLNWQIGSGLAMLFAAAWLTWRERCPVATIAAAAAASVVLFFCHLMGLVFFLVLIGSAEAYAMWRERAVLVRSASLLPVLTGPMVLWLLTALRDAPGETHWMTPQEKLLQLASPFINYLLPLDLISAALVFGAVALGVATSRIALAPRAIVAVAVLAILYVALPFDLMATSFLDTRIAIMLGFLLFAAVDPVRLPRQVRLAAGIGLTVLFAVRMAVVAEVWTEHRRDLADLRTVIAAVPPGASVAMTNVPLEEAPALLERGTAQQADLERSAHRISPASAADHRAGCILAAAVRHSRTTADPPAARLRQAGPRGVRHSLPCRAGGGPGPWMRSAARLRFRPDAGSRSGSGPVRLCPELPHPGVANRLRGPVPGAT